MIFSETNNSKAIAYELSLFCQPAFLTKNVEDLSIFSLKSRISCLIGVVFCAVRFPIDETCQLVIILKKTVDLSLQFFSLVQIRYADNSSKHLETVKRNFSVKCVKLCDHLALALLIPFSRFVLMIRLIAGAILHPKIVVQYTQVP